MRPKKPKKTAQNQLFKVRLEVICDARNALRKLGDAIDWQVFDEEFGCLYSDKMGRTGLPTRLMVGLHYLKHAFDVSDEGACAMLHENPYWQYFCGFEFFEHEILLDRSSMSNWRKRLGPEKVERLLGESFHVAKRSGFVPENETKKVVVDTSVQEKAISFPTDGRLYFKATRTLVKLAQRVGLNLRQSYKRVSKKALFKQGRYLHAKQGNRAKAMQRKLKTYLGRVIRDIGRKLESVKESRLTQKLRQLLPLAQRIYSQQRKDSPKVYAVHAPEVECIAKGKVHQKYEFGCKVSLATTLKNCWIVGAQALHQNPYDGHTLKEQIDQVERLAKERPTDTYVDQGYRGVTHHPEDLKTHICGKKTKDKKLRKEMKRRSSIEPIIGHLKSDHRMGRNYLKGQNGDKINVLLAASGKNLRKWMNHFLLPILQHLRNFIFSLTLKMNLS